MKHLIIFPYYREDELFRFELLGSNWPNLTIQQNVDFLFLERWNSTSDSKKCREIFKNYGNVYYLKCKDPKKFFLNKTDDFQKKKNASEMFIQCFEYISNNLFSVTGFCFWFESDVLICDPNWIRLLEQEWSFSNAVLLGHKIGCGEGEHINGVACYDKYIINCIESNLCKLSHYAFDVYLYRELKNTIYSPGVISSNLWEHRLTFECEEIKSKLSLPLRNKCIIHGIKKTKDYKTALCKILSLSKHN